MPPSLLPPSPEELEELRAQRRLKLPPGVQRATAAAPTRGSVAPVPGIRYPAEFIGGFAGANQRRSVMEPDATGLESAYRAGEATSVLGDLFGSLTPFATASTLSRVGALPGAAVIKPKGGNWLAGSVERALGPLKKSVDPELAGYAERGQNLMPHEAADVLPKMALNKWIDTKLGKYVRNELGTPEDPVRALAEREILHFTPRGGAVSAHTNREMLGMPTEPTATSPLAQSWEDVADATIRGGPYREKLPMSVNEAQIDVPETLRQLGGEYAVQNPDALAYELNRGMPLSEGLGFKHLIDELRNATDPDSGLPRSLQLSPEKLQKVTVPQAVELVDKINKWRAEQKAAADLKRSKNAATVEYKAYDTVPGTTEPNQRGLRWVELRTPEITSADQLTPEAKAKYQWYLTTGAGEEAALRQAAKHDESLAESLKYEGEVMGHCVGGYCPDVQEGRSRIYSLRDAKGEPHVTVEVRPGIIEPRMNGDVKLPDEIVQIKGKANRAPKDEYLPFVQDFVRSGQWSDVGDLRNTGLIRKSDYVDTFTPEMLDSVGVGEYMTKEEFNQLADKLGGINKMAAGGAVRMNEGGKPPKRRASDLPGYGEGSAGALSDVVRGFMGEKPAEPTNPSELFRLAQALGAFPPVAGVVKGAKGVKSLGEMIDREVRKVRRLEELGKADLNVNIGRPAGPEVTGWHITQDTPGILKTGALTNRDVGAGNIQGYAPAHVGGAYFYSDPQLALAKREDLLEMLGQDPELAAQLPILRAQLRRGNRLLPDEDVGLSVPWQRSFEEGSFATGRPVMLNQVDRIYASDPDVMKDLIRDTAVRQRRYKGGGKVKAPANPNEPEVRGLPDPRLDNLQIYAQTVSREMFPKDAVKRDAARHIIASSILAQKLNPSLARGLGQGYELVNAPMAHIKSALGMGPVPAGYEMDTVNNALGSEMPFTTQAELQRNARQAIESGRARLTPDEAQPYRRGGAVKIETNPTLMADELLFKGYRR